AAGYESGVCSMERLKTIERVIGFACAVLLSSAVVLPLSAQTSNQDAAAAAKSHPIEWRDYAGSPEGNRYLDFNQITKENVSKVEVAWTYPYANTNTNAIVADGVIYAQARNDAIVALDAATGKEIWIHDGLTGMTRRGLNYWESKDGKDKRIIIAVADFLQEIDATTGKSIRSFGTNGA